jgi:hypothetical protein
MFHTSLMSCLALIATFIFAFPASAKRVNSSANKHLNKSANKHLNKEVYLQRQCTGDKSKCCAAERKKYCPKRKRKDSCLVDLVLKLNETDGDYKPLRYDKSKNGVGMRMAPGFDGRAKFSNVCWKHIGRKVPKKTSLKVVALGDSFFSGEGIPDGLAPSYKIPKNYKKPLFPVIRVWNFAGTKYEDHPFAKGSEYNGKVKPYYTWEHAPCHRSKRAPPTRAVELLDAAFNGRGMQPKVHFDYKNFACSGGTLINLYKKKQIAYAPDRGLPPIVNAAKMPLQLKLAKQWLKNKKADVVMVSAGGNDMMFSTFLEGCFTYELGDITSSTGAIERPNCVKNKMEALEKGECRGKNCLWKRLDRRYEMLISRILGLPAGLVPAVEKDMHITHESKTKKSIVFLREYPTLSYKGAGKKKVKACDKYNPTNKAYPAMLDEVEVNNYGSEGDEIKLKHDAIGFGVHFAMSGTAGIGTKAIDKHESESIHRLVRKLNNKMKKTVSRANKKARKGLKKGILSTRFHYIDGIRSRFGRHGFCASQERDRWIADIPDAFRNSGSLNGAFHPSEKGALEMAKGMVKVMKGEIAKLVSKRAISKKRLKQLKAILDKDQSKKTNVKGPGNRKPVEDKDLPKNRRR